MFEMKSKLLPSRKLLYTVSSVKQIDEEMNLNLPTCGREFYVFTRRVSNVFPRKINTTLYCIFIFYFLYE